MTCHAHAIPDDILLNNDTIFDRNHNMAIVSGGIHHKHLTRLSYDLDLKAHNFLGYRYPRVWRQHLLRHRLCHRRGGHPRQERRNRHRHRCRTRNRAASLYIMWQARTPSATRASSTGTTLLPDMMDSLNARSHETDDDDDIDFASDMRINFLVNTNQNLTLKLIMDRESGDYITLNGDGVIQSQLLQQGLVRHVWQLCGGPRHLQAHASRISSRRIFEFMPGGTIAFGGNPYNAPLESAGKIYAVNGVPLSDLRIGRSFSSNNIRVDCLMDITGTPQSPECRFLYGPAYG